MLDDRTIVACGSPPGASPRAVVRLSGPEAWALARAVFPELPRRGFRRAAGDLRLPGWPPAPAIGVAFRGPRSYTGEDMVELWVPGAPPLVGRLLRHLEAAGARPAGPGELTRRAFLHGRLDLPQAEAVLALTTSEDAAGVRAALRALGGGTGERVDAAKAIFLEVRVHLEAAIDFSDEDVELTPAAALAARLGDADGVLARLGRDAGRRPRAGTTPLVALRGPANAGKSSLLNALAGDEAALVSDRAGTTRDVVTARWRLSGGTEVLLADTAGDLSGPGTDLDGQARSAADATAREADLVLVVVDGREPAAARTALAAAPTPGLLVLNKVDLVSRSSEGERGGAPTGALGGALWTSARTGAGLAALGARVEAALYGGAAAPGSDLVATARQDGLLGRARQALDRARAVLGGPDPARAELAALEVTEALDALGELTGAVTTEDVLDRIFGEFCIGK